MSPTPEGQGRLLCRRHNRRWSPHPCVDCAVEFIYEDGECLFPELEYLSREATKRAEDVNATLSLADSGDIQEK
jgi:hypothetical protein